MKKELDARHYPDDVRILPTNNTVKSYQYAARQFKHLPSKSLDDIRATLLNEKAVVLTGGRDKRSNMSTTPADKMDSNLGERVTNFLALIGKKYVLQNSTWVFYILRSGKLTA